MSTIEGPDTEPRPFVERIVRLRDGTPVRVRALVPEDAESLRRGLAELSASSRHNRFLAPVSALTDAQVRHLVDVDGVNHVALGVSAPADDPAEEPVAVGRIIRYPDDAGVADLAITVADRWQRRGIGTVLGELLAEHRPAGVTRIRTMISTSNRAALALAQRMGRVERRPAGDAAYEIEIRPLDT